LDKDRNWTVLFICGASGVGKSSIAYELSRFYMINVMEVDDIHQAIKATSSKDNFPNIHYWDTGINWKEVGVSRNLEWLINVSKEMIPGIKSIVDNHLESNVPLIIEGDFLYPEFLASFENSYVKSIFINESDKDQIVQNYLNREGGEKQDYRAEVSIAYNTWLKISCEELGIKIIEARPWNNVLSRITEIM
jgi:2-phosphoglycerate kinase